MSGKVSTNGNIKVDELKIGDKIYEYAYGYCIESKVITTPVRSENGKWTWQSKILENGNIIDYLVDEKHPHYAPKLYNYKAYL